MTILFIHLFEELKTWVKLGNLDFKNLSLSKKFNVGGWWGGGGCNNIVHLILKFEITSVLGLEKILDLPDKTIGYIQSQQSYG